MAVSAIPAQSVPAPRIQSVDALRGAIMMLMAIDHIRDYVARSAQQFGQDDDITVVTLTRLEKGRESTSTLTLRMVR